VVRLGVRLTPGRRVPAGTVERDSKVHGICRGMRCGGHGLRTHGRGHGCRRAAARGDRAAARWDTEAPDGEARWRA
jgi:hypothetical protein